MPENNEEHPKKILTLEDEEMLQNVKDQLEHRATRLAATRKENPLKDKLKAFLKDKFSLPNGIIDYDEFHTPDAIITIKHSQTAEAGVFGKTLQGLLSETEKVVCSCGKTTYIDYGEIIARATMQSMADVEISTSVTVNPRK